MPMKYRRITLDRFSGMHIVQPDLSRAAIKIEELYTLEKRRKLDTLDEMIDRRLPEKEGVTPVYDNMQMVVALSYLLVLIDRVEKPVVAI